jgi:biopolymer transport protein ExbD
MPPKTLAKGGLVTLALALLLPWSYAHWLRTRTFEPVDKEGKMEAGRVQTESFEINLREDYNVQIDVTYGSNYVDEERECPFHPWSDTDWKVYRLNISGTEKRELWASSAEMLKQGEIPLGFKGRPGKYELEWSVPPARPCLNALHPRVHVYASSSGYEVFGGFILFVCIFAGGTGTVVALRETVAWVTGYFFDKRPPRMFPEMVLRNVIPRIQHRQTPLIRDFPNFGLLWGGVLYVLFNIFAMMTTSLPQIGLPVDFRGVKAVGVEKSPWTETVSVYVDARRGFLVNGRPVPREELRTKLKEELSRQIVWTVYLEADSDCPFMDAVDAMDTIQGLGAKLVWITPKTREEWNSSNVP